jgi:hypothetical protein
MVKKKVTLSIESEVYETFQKYCKENAILLSRKVELFMEKAMSEIGKNKKIMTAFAGFAALFLMIEFISAGVFSDINSIDFSGTYNNTYYNSSGFVSLNSSLSGEYASRIFSANSTAEWKNISWSQGAPYQQALPNNKQAEEFLNGINMSKNILLLHMDEVSGIVYDYSGEGNNGTSAGSVDYSYPSIINTGLKFNGVSNSYLTLSREIVLANADLWTAAFWANKTGGDTCGTYAGTCSMIMGKKGQSSDFIWLWTGNFFRYRNSAGTSFDFTNVTNFSGWHHYALVANGTEASLYVDGKYNSTIAGTTSLKITTIGDAHTAGYVMKGIMDEVALWNRTLSAEEISNLYKRGALKLNLSARSCDDPACSEDVFVNLGSNLSSPKTLLLANNSYFQYKFGFLSESILFSPELYNVTIEYENGTLTNDSDAPGVNLIYPQDNYTFLSTNNLIFNLSASDNTDLDNCTLYTDLSGSWLANETKIFSGTYDLNYWNFYNVSNGNYSWNAYCCDYKSNCAWNSTNFTLRVNYTPSAPPSSSIIFNFTPPTPANGSTIYSNYAEINLTINSSLALNEIRFNWNETEFTFYNNSMLLMMNFDNLSALGETSSKVADVSSNANNGTPFSGAIWTARGRYSGAYSFAGTATSIINLSRQISLSSSEKWTISFWANKSDSSVKGMAMGDNTGGTSDFIWLYSNNYLRFRNATGTSSVGNIDFTSITNFFGWHHYTLVANGTRLALYVDGALNSSLNGNTAFEISEISSNYGGTGQYCFLGSMDEIRVWTRELSPSEIFESYYGNLQKYEHEKWNFYTKQQNLPNGTHFYSAYAKDSFGIWNSTETRTLNVSSNSSGGGEAPSGTISVIWPVRYTTVQRDGFNKSNILIVGTYTGNATAIDAKFNNGVWQTIANSPSGGSFSANLTNQSVGQGLLELRFKNDNMTNTSVMDVGIGDVYAIAGQSNAEMRGINSQSYNSSLPFNATVYREDDAWLIANDPVDTGTNIGSCWPLLASHIVSGANIPIAFVSAARGGSSILEWQKGSLYYEVLTNQIYEATRGTNNIKGIFFFQGETDISTTLGGTKGDYSTYKSNLSKFAADLKSDICMDKLIVGQVDIYYGGNRTTNDNIRKAQQDAWDENENISYGPVTYDIGLLPDNVHFKTDAQLSELAKRYWAAIEEKYYGGSYGRGPRLQSTEYNSATKKLRLIFDKSLNQTTGMQGWRIDDGGKILTDSNITSASANSNILELTLGIQIEEGANISLGSYDDGHNKNVPRAAEGYNLPAEMIFSHTIYFIPLNISFISPTPNDNETIENKSAEIKASIFLNITEMKFEWNGLNYTFYDNSTLLFYNFNNISALGDNSTYTTDVSPNKNNGIMINGTLISADARHNKSAFFDGLDDYINVAGSNSLNFGRNNFTIELWVKRTANGRNGIVVKTDPSGTIDSSAGYALYFDESDFVGFTAQNSEINTKSDGKINTSDNWAHLAVVVERFDNITGIFHSNNVTFYKNGQIIGKKDTLGLGTGINSSYDLKIGMEPYTKDYYSGYIDELRIYSKAFSENEVRQHYNSNLDKYDEDSWIFYANQTNLTTGIYSYAAYAKEGSAEVSAARTLNVNIVMPSSAANLSNQSSGETWIYWNWTNPSSHFSEAIIYLDSINVMNTSDNYYNATGLVPNRSYTITLHTKDSAGSINNSDVNSTATTLPDITAPQVSSNSPQNGEIATSSIVQITITTNENAVCRYANFNANWSSMTQMPATNASSHQLAVTLPNGNYNYYFMCEDSYQNRMNISYHLYFIVEVPSSPGGDTGDSGGGSSGGGGGGNASATKTGLFEIGKLGETIISAGESRKIAISLKNIGRPYLNKCAIKGAGNYSLWIYSSDRKDVILGQKVEFVVSINVPKNAEAKKHLVEAAVECEEAKQRFVIGANVIIKKLSINIAGTEKKGNILNIKYSLDELAGQKQNVAIEAVLFGEGNRRIAESKESMIIEPYSSGKFSISIDITNASQENLNLLLNANSEIASTFVQEFVVLDSSKVSGFAIFSNAESRNKLFSALLIALFAVFAIWVLFRIFKHKRTHEKGRIISSLANEVNLHRKSWQNRRHLHR